MTGERWRTVLLDDFTGDPPRWVIMDAGAGWPRPVAELIAGAPLTAGAREEELARLTEWVRGILGEPVELATMDAHVGAPEARRLRILGPGEVDEAGSP